MSDRRAAGSASGPIHEEPPTEAGFRGRFFIMEI